MKKIIKKLKKLSLPVKIQLVVAIICTLTIGVYAWFAVQDRIEALSKIKEPPSINLASGGDDPALYITLENIDVTSGNEKFVVFSVEAGKYSAYDIQLSHTTNIPFEYELYRVREDANGDIVYTDHTRNTNQETGVNVETDLHYSIMTGYNYSGTGSAAIASGKVALTNINADLTDYRVLGSEDALASKDRRNYDTTNDEVNKYVKPLYSVARKIPQLNASEDGSADRDYFAIKIIWHTNPNIREDDERYWDYAFNNKETDIIYISAKENSIDN